MERIRHSCALQIVYEYVAPRKLLIFQILNRRFYLKFVSAVILPICIFTRKGLKVMVNSHSIEVLSRKLIWESISLSQSGQDLNYRRQYFKGKDRGRPTTSKIAQINHSQVYLLGGTNIRPSLLHHKYYVPRSCLCIDLAFSIVSEKESMIAGRRDFGIAHVANYIYVVGGARLLEGEERTCERYEVGKGKWSGVGELEGGGLSVACVVS